MEAYLRTAVVTTEHNNVMSSHFVWKYGELELFESCMYGEWENWWCETVSFPGCAKAGTSNMTREPKSNPRQAAENRLYIVDIEHPSKLTTT